MSELDFSDVGAVTFDCFGTLIDWESGILNAVQPILAPRGISLSEGELLERYAHHEVAIQTGAFMPYREVLGRALRGVCADLGVELSPEETEEFGTSVGYWPAFADTAPALRRLSQRYRLGAITNCDDDLFELTNRRLGVGFDWVITSQQVESYKPSLKNFQTAIDQIGLAPHKILHVAQSLFHDHVVAQSLGLRTIYIDRQQDKLGFGATPSTSAKPHATFPDLESFAAAAVK